MPRAILHSLVAALMLLLAVPPASAEDEGPLWEWRPYRVHAVLTADSDDPVSTGRLPALAADLSALTERVIGPGWQFETHQPAGTELPAVAAGVPAWKLLAKTEPAAADVWLRIHVRNIAGQTAWQIQSWQPELESTSPVVSGTTWDHRTLPEHLLAAIRNVFRPVARIDAVSGSDVRLQLRAGELPPADADLAWVREGDLLEVAVVFAAQGTTPGQRRDVPWTIVEIDSVDHATLHGRVHSGLRQALSARSRGRMQQLGILVRPWYRQTELVVQTFGKSPRRLGGSRVTLAEATGEDAPLPVELLTDRLGRLSLQPQESPLRWLTVWSGKQRLARVPVVPGTHSRLVLEVPDDSVRLDVEGELRILQDRLVDAVASRNTLLISLRKLARQERWQAVDAGRQKLTELPGSAPFLQELTGIRVNALKAVDPKTDRAAVIKINRLCDETADLIREHLGGEKLKVFREELAELERVSKANSGPPAAPVKPADR